MVLRCRRKIMILLALCRIGVCEICGITFTLPAGCYIPEKCLGCGSTEWELGVEPADGIRIRTGVTFAPRRPDGRRDRRKEPGQGARSLKRQKRAQRQGQSFQPKAVDTKTEADEN